MYNRALFIVLLLVMVVGVIVVARRFPVCDPPCQTNGHVPTCCYNHQFRGGICRRGYAYCYGSMFFCGKTFIPKKLEHILEFEPLHRLINSIISIMYRTLFVLFLLAMVAAVIVAAKRFPVCDPPCQTNGHLPTCCFNHKFDGGHCVAGSAYCT